jgi:hypothetical protein
MLVMIDFSVKSRKHGTRTLSLVRKRPAEQVH